MSYAINYEIKSVKFQSNLIPMPTKNCYLNADMCLAGSNFAFMNPDLEESLRKVDQIMQFAKDNSDYCTKLAFLKSVIGIFFNSFLPYSKGIVEEFSRKVENECPYGDGKILCIGIQQDECNKILTSHLFTN